MRPGNDPSKLTIAPDRRLFRFLRDGVTLDLTEPSMAGPYVQQVLTRGRADDVRQLFSASRASPNRSSA